MGQMPVAIVIYPPLPQCLFVVVETCMQAGGGLSRDVSSGRKKMGEAAMEEGGTRDPRQSPTQCSGLPPGPPISVGAVDCTDR
jgi:hypothetical protein